MGKISIENYVNYEYDNKCAMNRIAGTPERRKTCHITDDKLLEYLKSCTQEQLLLILFYLQDLDYTLLPTDVSQG